jgi:hypothetical protein
MTSQHLDVLKNKIEAAKDHGQVIGAVLDGLADALDGLTQDPVAIKQLATDLRACKTDLSNVIATKIATTGGQTPAPPPGINPPPGTVRSGMPPQHGTTQGKAAVPPPK